MSGTTATDCSAPPPPPSRARPATHPFAWQGWRLPVPTSWNPVKLEGDFAKGYALLADFDGPRLGVRWTSVPGKDVSDDLLRRVIRDEAGEDASARAKSLPVTSHNLLHFAGEAPGRDVYVWWSATSQRLLEIVYHAPRRDDVLVEQIVRSLSDCSDRSTRPWAVLDLSCAVPAALELKSRRLDAGDLQLEFEGGDRFVTLRQIALAQIALRRKPLEAWLIELQRARQLKYRALGAAIPVTIDVHSGFLGRMRRRNRFFWIRGSAPECVTIALHDAARDRIVLVEASDEPLARDVAQAIGRDFD
jgi:hypothetical protein